MGDYQAKGVRRFSGIIESDIMHALYESYTYGSLIASYPGSPPFEPGYEDSSLTTPLYY